MNTVEEIQRSTEKESDTPNVEHLQYELVPIYPGMLALCGAVLKGIDYGIADGPRPETCVICCELAWGSR